MAQARSWAVDLGPLRRHRDYRLLFVGRGVSFFGSMITYVAVPYQVFRLTHSSLAVGLLGLAEIVPLVAAAVLGGALADAHDRRRMVQLAELGQAAVSVGLVANALLDHSQLWVLYLAAASAATFDGIQRPSFDAMLPRLVDHDDLPAVGALEGMRGTVGLIAGPALAGLLIASIGLAGTYGIDVATFAVSLYAWRMVRAVPPPPDAGPPSIAGILEGFRYAASRQELMGTYLVDMNAMFFGMPNALFPALAVRLHGGPGALGLLYAAPAVGALVATIASGWVRRIRRHGLAIAWAAAGWGVAIVAFGVSPSLSLAIVFLAIAGAADMVSGLFRMTMWNQTIPDHLRGRLAGIEMLSYASGPSLGNVEAGTVAALAGLRASIVSGGVMCVLGSGLLAWRLPKFRAYRAN
ncbi:MAG: MFS transporter [Acidimicrobiales bacterium]